MLALSRRQATIFLLVFVSFIVALIAAMAIIHAIDPGLWQNVLKFTPNVMDHY